jgi:hypothetical protein
MPDQESIMRNSWDATVRLLTVVGAALVMIWIGVGGIMVAFRDPYLIPALPFLGIGGLACCIGALACVRKGPSKETRVPLCLQALGWLSGAVGVAFLLWNLGRPSGVGHGPEVILIGVLMSGAAILGLVGVIVSAMLLLVVRDEGTQTAKAPADKSSPEAKAALDLGPFEPNLRALESTP